MVTPNLNRDLKKYSPTPVGNETPELKETFPNAKGLNPPVKRRCSFFWANGIVR